MTTPTEAHKAKAREIMIASSQSQTEHSVLCEMIALALAEAEKAGREEAERRLVEAEAKLNACHWYWPENDTSEDCCSESAYETVDRFAGKPGSVIAVSRGGIVETTYCASLPPADDADSDDDFWVEETTEEAAQAKIDDELARRTARAFDGGKDG